jgi:hypothetical protein
MLIDCLNLTVATMISDKRAKRSYRKLCSKSATEKSSSFDLLLSIYTTFFTSIFFNQHERKHFTLKTKDKDLLRVLIVFLFDKNISRNFLTYSLRVIVQSWRK